MKYIIEIRVRAGHSNVKSSAIVDLCKRLLVVISSTE